MRTDTTLKPMRWIEQLPIARERFVLGVSATVAIASAAWILRTVAAPYLPPGFPYVTFFPAVIVTSFLFGARLGSLSALLCGLLAWYFFIPPARGFVLTQAAGLALAFYVFVVTMSLALAHWRQVAHNRLALEQEANRTPTCSSELYRRNAD